MRAAIRRGLAASAGIGFLAGGLASCGGAERSGQATASGGAGSGGEASSGGKGATGGSGAVDSGGSPSVNTGGSQPVGTGGSQSVDMGGASAVDAGEASGGTDGAGGRSTDGSADAIDASFDLCVRHGAPCCVPAIAHVTPGTGCTIEVFDKYVNATYEYAALEEKVAALSAGIAVTVTSADIASATAEPPPARRMELRLTPEASARLGPALEGRAMFPFRFSCGGEQLFLGVVYWWEGAAALRTPVLHVKRTADGAVVLLLGAWQSAWMGLGGSGNVVFQERIDRAELRAPLCEKGILKELDPAQRGWTDMPPRGDASAP